MVRMLYHRISQIWDPWTPQQIEAFKASVEQFGQLEAVTIWHGEIVDGKNRWPALREMGREPDTETLPDEWDEDKVYAYVCARHLRREEDDIQRRRRINRQHAYERERAKERQRAAGGDKKSEEAKANAELSENAAENRLGPNGPKRSEEPKGRAAEIVAKKNDIPVNTVKRMVAVEEKGTPELKQAVDEKKVSLSKAAEIAKKPPAEQKAAVAKLRGEEPPAPDPAAEPVNPLVAVIDEARSRVLSLQLKMTALEKAFDEACGLPGFGIIAANEIALKQSFEKFRDVLKQDQPFGVCPKCGGSKCETCGERGWVTAGAWTTFSDEAKAKVYSAK